MNEVTENRVITDLLKRGYRQIFEEQWPIMTGGIMIGILSIVTFAWGRPWGVVGGLRNWAHWLSFQVGWYDQAPLSPLFSTNSIMSLGLLWGAIGAALMSRQFGFQMAPPLELFKGCIGGTLMGLGAAMAGGCNVGGFYSAVSALSLGGLLMMVGLILGAMLGLKYLYWELEHLPQGSSGGSSEPDSGIGWKKYSPWIGALVLISAFYVSGIYRSMALTRTGGLLLCGLAFGIVIQRSRFCFVRAFRDPFMTGEGEVGRAVSVSLIISILGFAALKWTGLRGEDVFVSSTIWIGSLLGGFIFGFGMLLSGGCGSGSLWRAGEGQLKLILAIIFFSFSNFLFKTLIDQSEGLTSLMGVPVFLPDWLTYLGSVVVLALFFGAYYIFVSWNEETDAAVLEM